VPVPPPVALELERSGRTVLVLWPVALEVVRSGAEAPATDLVAEAVSCVRAGAGGAAAGGCLGRTCFTTWIVRVTTWVRTSTGPGWDRPERMMRSGVAVTAAPAAPPTPSRVAAASVVGRGRIRLSKVRGRSECSMRRDGQSPGNDPLKARQSNSSSSESRAGGRRAARP
jgi:hypothetical protein